MGAVLGIQTSDIVTVTLSTFVDNHATQGGVVYATNRATIQMHDVTISFNMANLGVMYFIESTGIISGNTEFSGNAGSLFAYNSNIIIPSLATLCSVIPQKFHQNQTTQYFKKGVVTAFQNDILFHGICTLMNNFAIYKWWCITLNYN